MESAILSHFFKHIVIDTQPQDEMDAIPSTDKQRNLARLLVEESDTMGASDVRMDEHAYVCATVPAITDNIGIMVLGLVAHMDTSPAYSGAGVNPQIVRQYGGGDILVDPDTGLTMHMVDFPDPNYHVDQDLITIDGSTLLEADDEVGVVETMVLAGYLLSYPEIRHGTTKTGFVPSEEVGCGADLFDVVGFGADVAYTVDGGKLGKLGYENFSMASVEVHIHSSSTHPGSSKGKMKNAIPMAMEFQSMLSVLEDPMCTEGYEGLYHLDAIEGTVEYARTNCIIRDHDMIRFQEKKTFIEQIADYLNRRHGDSTIELLLKDSYFSTKEKIELYMYLIDTAKVAMGDMKIKLKVHSIREGTDGARLSYMGLPCPNLCTGSHDFHGKYEFISIQSMERVVELLLNIVKNIGA